MPGHPVTARPDGDRQHDKRPDSSGRGVSRRGVSGPGVSEPSVSGRGASGGDVSRHHGNRHGRSEPARIAVLEAADDLLVERGFAGVTIEGIAAKAGVAKQTIYRWWESKTDILFDALMQDAAEFFTGPDTGDLGADLRARLRELATFLARTDAGAVFRALAGQAQHDPAVATRFESDFMAGQRDLDRQPFLRALRRGELAATADVELAIDQLTGPVYYRVLLSGQPVTPDYTDALVDSFLAAAC